MAPRTRRRGERGVVAGAPPAAEGNDVAGASAATSSSTATSSGGSKAAEAPGTSNGKKAGKPAAKASASAPATEDFVDCESPAADGTAEPARDFLDCDEAEHGAATTPGAAEFGTQVEGPSGQEQVSLPDMDDVGAAASSATSVVPAHKAEPLHLPVPSRPDWGAEMRSLAELVQDPNTLDDQKVNLLHEALIQRIEDVRNLEDCKTQLDRRHDDACKERGRVRNEVQRANSNRAKLENSCRDLQQKKTEIDKENQRIAEEEQTRHAELKDKFQQAIQDVQEKMDAELEVRQRFLQENEELSTKYNKFTESYEAQEKHNTEKREISERDMKAAEEQLQAYEKQNSDSKMNAAALEKQNEVLRKSQATLREELQTVLGKFDQFHEAVTGSNTRHSEIKVDIDTLRDKLQDLEQENADLKANKEFESLSQEEADARRKRDALEKLCNNLEKEIRKLKET